MKQINVSEILMLKYPTYFKKLNPILKKIYLALLNSILKVNKVNEFLSKNEDKYGIDFIDELFEYLDFSYKISAKDKMKIPSEGKLIIVSNHPLGALDGLSLVKMLSEIRPDVKIVANDVLLLIDNLKDCFLPVDVFGDNNKRKNYLLIGESLKKEQCLIFFPSGEVSRFSLKGIRDGKWQKGAVKFARRYNVPILPIYINSRNSMFFYFISFINRNLSTLFLVSEMFKKKSAIIDVLAGNVISGDTISKSGFNENQLAKLLRKHVLNLATNSKPIFKTENTVIHPISGKLIKSELNNNKLLGKSRDGKFIFLVSYDKAPNSIKEISRLREITFRKVGEGTGNKKDTDQYDKIYKHIVLWDNDNLEIVGSYRLGICKEIMEKYGLDYIYNSSQFTFSNKFADYLYQSVEVGRSFIQEKYWGSNALDYLWQGIGAFLKEYPDVKYLYGAVSISNTYSNDAKSMIVSYYKKWYYNSENLAKAKNKFIISENQKLSILSVLKELDKESDFKNLKNYLRNYSMSVPILLKKYTEICEEGSATFLDFGVDVSFANSVDCLILVDLNYLKDEFKSRYLFQQNSFVKELALV